jgi:flavin reductase (DIM6/NTAB) family NADH-FMN oxidoreductase RutF
MSSNTSRVTTEQFRRACGRFATGVTVATVLDAGGNPHGLTVNSFTSVSLEPPLVLVCLGHRISALEHFREATHFGINILACDQEALSEHFARRGHNRFASLEWYRGNTGVPLLPGVAAALECAAYSRIKMGDHDIFVGEAVHAETHEKQPLLFHASGYHRL